MPASYDGGRCFRELFEQPDGWRETRAAIDVLFCTDLDFQKQFADDQHVIENWLEAPNRCVPETADFTFTRWVLDFARKFARQKP